MANMSRYIVIAVTVSTTELTRVDRSRKRQGSKNAWGIFEVICGRGSVSILAYGDRTKAAEVARRNNLFSWSNVIMAGLRRVQTAERVHYYFSRKCMVWTNQEEGHVWGMRARDVGGDTRIYRMVNIVPDRQVVMCGSPDGDIANVRYTGRPPASNRVDHNFRFLLTMFNYFYRNSAMNVLLYLRITHLQMRTIFSIPFFIFTSTLFSALRETMTNRWKVARSRNC